MLIIDTSSEKLKVILNSSIIYVNGDTGSKHLQQLLPQIDLILTNANLKLKDIKNLCVVSGPGSFTGVRIGISTVKAFKMAFPDKNIVSINMFDLLKYSIFSKLEVKTKIAIIIKSTATKYYFALISQSGIIEEMSLLTNAEILDKVNKNNAQLFSYNLDYCYENLKSTMISLINEDYLNFAKEKINNKEFVELKDLKPLYLALSQAEEELLKKANNNV